jgi:diguanylate cyclase (GGDEF)-like protein/PAS domain S-box-containing protein
MSRRVPAASATEPSLSTASADPPADHAPPEILFSQRRPGPHADRALALLSQAASIARLGSFERDIETGYATWSEQMLEMFGLAQDQARDGDSRPFRELIHPDDLPRYMAMLDSVAATGAGGEFVMRVGRGGEERVMRARARRVTDDGTPRLVGTVVDITESHRLHVEAAAARDLLEATLAAATETAIVATDARGVITVFNTGAERMLGYRAQDVIGQARPWIYHDLAEVSVRATELGLRPGQDPITHPAAKGRIETREWTFVRADGTRLTAALTISALRDGDATLTGFMGVARDVTGERRAERARRESEQRLRSILEGLPGTLVALYDEQLRCVACEGAVLGGHGLQRDAIVGRTLQELLGARAWDTLQTHFRAALDGTASSFDAPSPLGEEIFHTKVAPYRVDGELLGVLAVSHDVTEERRAEQRLREEQRLLAETQAAARIGSWEQLESGGRRWSEEQYRLHGLEPGSPIPESEEYLALVHPDDVARTESGLRRAMEEHLPFDFEYRVNLPDGATRMLQTQGTYLAAGDGRPARFCGTTRDVTDATESRAARQAAEEQFRRSFDDALIGMTIFDLDGRYLRVNDAFCAIIGHPRETLIGLARAAITHPDDVAGEADALQGLRDGTQSSFAQERRYIHAAGHPVWTAVGVTLVRDAEGRPLHFIGQAQDITERRRYEDQLRHMADHDPLTGLLNRRSFARELDGHLTRARRYGADGAVLMIDLDNFKYFNDTQGHNAGDELIVRIAHTVRDRLRESDVVARLGGDEFAVLLPRESREAAERVALDILERVRLEAPSSGLGEEKRVTASIGIAALDGAELQTADEIMVCADLAMYEAKERGRNGLAHYRTEHHDRPRIESQMKWATEITDALADERFELVAQPIRPLGGGGPGHYELLLRMRLTNGDVVPPGTFLYIAERLNLIQEIDRWVTDQAITMLAENTTAGHDMRLEVNLSGHSIGDPKLLALVERRLAETGAPAERLIFEITETSAVANMARAAAFADRLSELGCKFALDDFGAGFGSFYYLKHLPFDYLKIDGEFVAHCAESETDRTLISAVVQIARGMGKQTIAEFVGDEETVELLAEIGVNYGQGYHLGRPAPLSEHLAAAAA